MLLIHDLTFPGVLFFISPAKKLLHFIIVQTLYHFKEHFINNRKSYKSGLNSLWINSYTRFGIVTRFRCIIPLYLLRTCANKIVSL